MKYFEDCLFASEAEIGPYNFLRWREMEKKKCVRIY
jgi:hypothetical protein